MVVHKGEKFFIHLPTGTEKGVLGSLIAEKGCTSNLKISL